jgi:transposase
LACHLYEQLGLDEFWAERLADSREGTCWQHILQTLVCYRLIDPGSECRLHRQWFDQSAMGDLLDEDYSLVEKNALYRCLDKVLKHKEQLFGHLRQRWQDLFGARFEVLLYDLTSTYFESDPAFEETDKRQFGYSRDKRPDCVQVVIGLIVSPEGFPLAYEVLPGNTSDKTTLRERKIEEQYAQGRPIRTVGSRPRNIFSATVSSGTRLNS